jgi:hypothetical protein
VELCRSALALGAGRHLAARPAREAALARLEIRDAALAAAIEVRAPALDRGGAATAGCANAWSF